MDLLNDKVDAAEVPVVVCWRLLRGHNPLTIVKCDVAEAILPEFSRSIPACL